VAPRLPPVAAMMICFAPPPLMPVAAEGLFAAPL
jgi:hypothetical protein